MPIPDWMIDTPSASVDDLAALVARLAHSLRKATPDNDLPSKAMDYLARHGIAPSPLREVQPSQAEVQAEPVAWKYEVNGQTQFLKNRPSNGTSIRNLTPLYTAPQAQPADALDAETPYQRGYRHGYNQRDAEVQGALL